MSHRLVALFAGLFVGLAARPSFASQPVPVWEYRMRGELAGGSSYPATMRTLADGSTLAVLTGNRGVSAARFGPDGSVRSVVALPGASNYGTLWAIDPFGAIFVSQQFTRYGPSYGFWTMKYDGVTGKAMWLAPRILEVSGNAYAGPSAIAAASNGDVVVAGFAGDGSGRSRWVTIRYGRETGAVRWGPVFLGDGSESSSPYTISFDSVGDVLIAGSDSPWSPSGGEPGWTIVKYDGQAGLLLWKTNRVGVPSIPMVCPLSCFTPYGVKLALDRDRNVILTVSSFASTSSATGNYQEWLTTKYAGSNGAKLWGPVSFNGGGGGYEAPQELAVDAAGDVFVVGTASTPSRTERAVVKDEGATGRAVWGPVFLGAFGVARGLGMVLDGFGNAIVTGIPSSYPGDQPNDWNAVSLSGRSGTPLWLQRILPAVGGSPSAISLSANAGVVVAGNSPETNYQARILAIRASTGVPLWGPRAVSGVSATSRFPVSLAADSEGNALVVSQTFDGSGDVRASGDILKVDRETGRSLWGPIRFSDAPNSWPTVTAIDPDQNVFVTGFSSHGANTDWETVKYDGSTGAVIWGPSVMDRGGSSDVPSGLVVDAQGDPIVVGKTETPNVITWAVIKYDGRTGAVVWGPVVYEPPLFDTRRQSEAVRVLVDSSGDVVVSAVDRTSPERTIWVTTKYDGATGAGLWGPVPYEPPLFTSGYPLDAGVDAYGDVIAAGAAGPGWTTLKYSGRTGSVMWGPVGRTRNSGRARKVLVDRNNDVFVVGEDGPQQTRFAVVKYSGTTGEITWSAIGASAALPYATNLSSYLDPAGNLIVLASSHNGLNADWTTTKFSGATGQILWGPTIHDGGEDDRPVALVSSGTDFLVSAIESGDAVTMRFTEGLGILTLPEQIGLSYCAQSYRQPVTASNGQAPYSWAIVEGALPEGLVLTSDGEIVGEAVQEGSFRVVIQVTDAAGSSARREFAIEVLEGGERPTITFALEPICPSGYALELDESYASYSWLPDGQTSPSISVCPEQLSLYGVVATDQQGCAHRAAIELGPAPVPARQPIIRPVRSRLPPIPRNR